MSNTPPRFDAIMAIVVLEWADTAAAFPSPWWGRYKAEQEVRCILDQPYYAAQMTDEEIAEQAINAWLAAE
jgi:hypothetical protein